MRTIPLLMPQCAALLLLTAAVPIALTPPPALAAPAHADFQRFFTGFRAAVLAGDRARVANMFALPFKDFAGGEVDRSATTRAQILSHYDQIFTPSVIAAIRAGKFRTFEPGSDDGEAPGPLGDGEYLLQTPSEAEQLVFSPKGGTFVVSRTPFYS